MVACRAEQSFFLLLLWWRWETLLPLHPDKRLHSLFGISFKCAYNLNVFAHGTKQKIELPGGQQSQL